MPRVVDLSAADQSEIFQSQLDDQGYQGGDARSLCQSTYWGLLGVYFPQQQTT